MSDTSLRTLALQVVPDAVDGPPQRRRQAAIDHAREQAERVDWALVSALRSQAATHLSELLADRPAATVEEQRELAHTIIGDLLLDHARERADSGGRGSENSRIANQRLRQAVMDSLFGLGRLQPLIDDPELENIEIFSHDRTFLHYAGGRIVPGPPVADSQEELRETLAFIAARQQVNERPFSPAAPFLNLRLDGGPRMAASSWVSADTSVVIRLHRLVRVSLADLVGLGMMSIEVADFLDKAVKARKSIVVSGEQGAGKTTMIRALAGAIDPMESIGTIETEFELHLHELVDRHPRCHAWETRPGSGERGPDGRVAGEISMADLVEQSYRYNLSRIIVGEVRGPEVISMFNAMGGGAGSMCSVHADDAAGVVQRMITLSLGAGPHVTVEFAKRQIAEHIDIIVQIGVKRAGDHATRYVSQVAYVEHNGDGVALTDLWRAPRGSTVAEAGHMPAHLAEELGWRR